jgi:hypothetical protein
MPEERNLPTLDNPEYKKSNRGVDFFPLIGTGGPVGGAPRRYRARPLLFRLHRGDNGISYRLKFRILESDLPEIPVGSIWELPFFVAEKVARRNAQMASLVRFICTILHVNLSETILVDPLRNTLLDLSDAEMLGDSSSEYDFTFQGVTTIGTDGKEYTNFYPVAT